MRVRAGRHGPLVLMVAMALAGCGADSGQAKDDSKKPGALESMVNIKVDLDALSGARGAVAEAVRAAGDCEQLAKLTPVAREKLAAVEGRLRTAAGRGTFDQLKAQLEAANRGCP